MNNNKIIFKNLPWTTLTTGAQQKECTQANMKMRLIQFTDTFVEPDWCTKGHLGYVVKGEMGINFNGKIIRYQQGNGLSILTGEERKHKVVIEPGKSVELIVFELV